MNAPLLVAGDSGAVFDTLLAGDVWSTAREGRVGKPTGVASRRSCEILFLCSMRLLVFCLLFFCRLSTRVTH